MANAENGEAFLCPNFVSSYVLNSRWCNVLDKCTESGDWTPEEDERLALGVRVFGRGIAFVTQ